VNDDLMRRVIRYALSVGPPFPRPLELTEDERRELAAHLEHIPA